MLKCIQYFRQGLWEFGAGDTVNQHPALEDWLVDSYPAHFVRVEPVIEPAIEAPAVADEVPVEDEAQPEVIAADIAEPPADKAIKRPRGRK